MATPAPQMAKKTRFAFRTTEEFKHRIAHVAEILGLDQAVVGEAALEAVVSYVEKYGELTIPIRLEPHEIKVQRPAVQHTRPAASLSASAGSAFPPIARKAK